MEMEHILFSKQNKLSVIVTPCSSRSVDTLILSLIHLKVAVIGRMARTCLLQNLNAFVRVGSSLNLNHVRGTVKGNLCKKNFRSRHLPSVFSDFSVPWFIAEADSHAKVVEWSILATACLGCII